MKKINLLSSLRLAGGLTALVAAFATTSARADIVYITGCVSNCASTTLCGSGLNPDVNQVLFVPVYQDPYSAYTSAKASGSGVADKPVDPGSRYISNSFSNSSPDGTMIILSPELGVPGGIYRLDHTFSSAAGNVSATLLVGLTNITTCTLSTNATDKFRTAFGAAPNSWSTLCYVTNDVDTANPQIGLYFLDGIVSAGSANRLVIECFRFVLYQPCLDVAQPTISGPIAANLSTVNVSGVLSNATNVAVWQDTGSGMVKISSLAVTNPAATVAVPTSGLVAGAKVAGSQTAGGIESCAPTAGTLVGGGANPSLRVALSIRSNPNLVGPVWTPGGGTNSNIYFLGASAILSGSGPDDSMVIYPSNNWQTVTLQRGSDPFNPINPTVLWNNGASAPPELQGDYGALDGIAFSCDGDPGNFTIFIDDIANGTNGVVENYEGLTAGTTVGFSQPSFSGTTASFILGAPNQSSIVTGVAYSGTNSTRVQWQYVSGATNQWLRLVHSGNTGVANPQVNLNEPISFKLLLVPVGQPPAPTLTYTHAANKLILNWVGSFPLQTATNVAGAPWIDVGVNTGPYTNTIGAGAKYFRLHSNP